MGVIKVKRRGVEIGDMLYSSCQEKNEKKREGHEIMRFFLSKKGDVVSETTYGRLIISEGIIPILIFPFPGSASPKRPRIT